MQFHEEFENLLVHFIMALTAFQPYLIWYIPGTRWLNEMSARGMTLIAIEANIKISLGYCNLYIIVLKI